MKIVVNLTQHASTPEQWGMGVVDLPEDIAKVLREDLTFEEIPSSKDLEERAAKIVALLKGAQGGNLLPRQEVMIGGAPYFMAPLERALRAEGIRPLYAFSRRESVDELLPNGGVKKVTVFRHVGFVEP